MKLSLIQSLCVIAPLLVIDSLFVYSLHHAERILNLKKLNDCADSVIYTVSQSFEAGGNSLKKIYMNRYVNDFILETQFDGPLDYYQRYFDFTKKTMYDISGNTMNVVIYADNPSIFSGGMFRRSEQQENQSWYEQCLEKRDNVIVGFEYAKQSWELRRYVFLAHAMDYYHKGQGKSVIRLDIDYSRLRQDIMNAKYESTLYICTDGKILFSNEPKGGVNADFKNLTANIIDGAAVKRTFSVYQKNFELYVMPIKKNGMELLKNNIVLLLFIVFINIFLPLMIMHAMLEAEYENKIKQQEANIARHKAQLLALHSQINPHFLFNALESIRMHSVIKKEDETAEMVEKLALLERQYTEWRRDVVSIEEEISFISAYLELQKYRFGDRLNYKIEVEAGAESFVVPKLALVTFVENACVHGTENKNGKNWIFVRVYTGEDKLILEIEDTGKGMSREELREFQKRIDTVTIEMIQENSRIGSLNAALRLNLFYDGDVSFKFESEESEGTFATITIPLATALLMRDISGKDDD